MVDVELKLSKSILIFSMNSIFRLFFRVSHIEWLEGKININTFFLFLFCWLKHILSRKLHDNAGLSSSYPVELDIVNPTEVVRARGGRLLTLRAVVFIVVPCVRAGAYWSLTHPVAGEECPVPPSLSRPVCVRHSAS